MLEKPDIQDETIIANMRDEYDLIVDEVAFLPLGADVNAAVYRLITRDGTPCFLKLKRGDWDETAVIFPKFLSDQGIAAIIPPRVTTSGRLWGNMGAYKTTLYPFVSGRNGYETTLSPRHWHDFAVALRQLHAIKPPPTIANLLRRENYSPRYREAVKQLLASAENDIFNDPIAIKSAAFLRRKHAETMAIITRTEQLAAQLQAQTPAFVICHADIHAGNILIGDDGALYIVDWDDLIFAPKERDLMYVGSGLISDRAPQEEESLFYPAYGQTAINKTAITYYRYERIIQDIAAFGKSLLLTNAGGADRERSLYFLKSNYNPSGTIAIAHRADNVGVA